MQRRAIDCFQYRIIKKFYFVFVFHDVGQLSVYCYRQRYIYAP